MYTLQQLARKAQKTTVTEDHRQGSAAPLAGRDMERQSVQDAALAAMHDDENSWNIPEVSLSAVFSWLLRYWWIIILLALLGAMAGLGFGKFAEPRFKTGTDIWVAPSGLQVVPNDVFAQNLQAESQLMDVESRLRVLTSGNVMRSVVEKLKLQDDPEFNGTATSALADLFGSRGADSAPATEQGKIIAAIRELSSRVEARRTERTYVVSFTVWARSPEKAVVLADTIAKAFQDEVADNERDGAMRAAQALMDQLDELRKSATEAEMKVAQFRNAQGLQTSGNGELVSTQSLSQINSQLVTALTRQAEAKSRYDELSNAKNQTLDPLSTLQSPTLTALRTQYATLKQRVDAMTMTYGPRYPELASAQSQIAGLQSQITQEATRVLHAAKLELDQANSVVESLRRQTASARSVVSLDNDAQVTLNDLERERLTKTTVYQASLTRAQEIAQRQQINATNISIMSTALPPKSRSWPPATPVLMAGGAIAGAGAGAILAILVGFIGLMRRKRLLIYI
jgi:succinoglycan biosynthesis transport protein ExoP